MITTPSFRTLIERVQAAHDVYQIKLPVSEKSLSPVLSEAALHLHYDILYKNYVKKSLDGEGEFQTAGAKLHTLFFEQFQAPKNTNNPSGPSLVLINDKFGTYSNFKAEFSDIASSIQGSGWAYLSTNGKIKVIKDHKLVDDVAVLIDVWEHAYQLDYAADKLHYLRVIWKIINWDIINVRLNQDA